MSKILCIEKDILPACEGVNKTIDVGEALKTHTMPCEVNEMYSLGYVPCSFLTVVRTARTNLVLEFPSPKEEDNNKFYYNFRTGIDGSLIHKGYDLIMYMASVSLISAITDPTQKEFDDVMLASKFLPCGYFINANEPVFYSQIILSDRKADIDLFKSFLREGYKLVPISEMKRDGNLDVILNTIIEIPTEAGDKSEQQI